MVPDTTLHNHGQRSTDVQKVVTFHIYYRLTNMMRFTTSFKNVAVRVKSWYLKQRNRCLFCSSSSELADLLFVAPTFTLTYIL